MKCHQHLERGNEEDLERMVEDRDEWRLCLVCLMVQGGGGVRNMYLYKKMSVLRQSLLKVFLFFKKLPWSSVVTKYIL